MVVSILKGVYTMKDCYVIIKENQEQHKKVSKKLKTIILDELSKVLHMNKQYLSYLLRSFGKVITRKCKVVVVANIIMNSLFKRGRKKGHLLRKLCLSIRFFKKSVTILIKLT